MEYLLYSFIWWQVLSITVVSSGYHRYFAHRAFKAPVWYEWYVLILGLLTGGGSLLGWAGVHRLHHNHENTDRDPHSPHHHGFWKVLTSTFEVPAIRPRVVKDLLRNPRVMFVHHNYHWLRSMSLLIPLIVLPWNWYVVLILSPVVYSYIGFGLINAFCHKTNGKVRNSHLLNILAGGDGFHRNHHDDPRNWRIGKKWHQLDPGAWFIRLIKK